MIGVNCHANSMELSTSHKNPTTLLLRFKSKTDGYSDVTIFMTPDTARKVILLLRSKIEAGEDPNQDFNFDVLPESVMAEAPIDPFDDEIPF